MSILCRLRKRNVKLWSHFHLVIMLVLIMVLIVLNQLILRCHAGLNMANVLNNATAGKNLLKFKWCLLIFFFPKAKFHPFFVNKYRLSFAVRIWWKYQWIHLWNVFNLKNMLHGLMAKILVRIQKIHHQPRHQRLFQVIRIF